MQYVELGSLYWTEYNFKSEYNNKHDRFVLAGKRLLGHIAPITVGHVSRELS